MKNKVDKSDVDKLVPVPVDLTKLIDVAKMVLLKKDVYNAKIKNIEDKIPDITNLTTNTTLNAKINQIKGEIPSATNVATTAALTSKIVNVYILYDLDYWRKIPLRNFTLRNCLFVWSD